MPSEAAPALRVFVRALVIAQSSGASEIAIDHLLAALDTGIGPNEPIAGLIAERYVPVPKQDMPFAPDVTAAALEPLGEIFAIPLDVLRRALVSEKREGEL